MQRPFVFCTYCSWFGRAISITTADAPGARILDATIATILLHFTWQCVKTHGIPCSSHQNSWALWMFIPLKMVLIGIDP